MTRAITSRFGVWALARRTSASGRADGITHCNLSASAGPRFGVRALARKSAVLAKARTPNLGPIFALFLVFALHPQTAHACAVCFGKSDSAMAKGMNIGIFALLTCITGVLATLATFFIFLAVRASKHPQPQGDAMVASLHSPENPAHS